MAATSPGAPPLAVVVVVVGEEEDGPLGTDDFRKRSINSDLVRLVSSSVPRRL